MKKITIVIALFFSVLAVQAQTKTNPIQTDTKTPDDQESLAKDYLRLWVLPCRLPPI
jgi:lipoprotein Spr